MKHQKYQIIILAAGLGKRMRSALPKVLHKVCGQSLIERTIRAVSVLRPSQIIVVAGHGKELLKAELEQIKSKVDFGTIVIECVLQTEQLGTGDAVRSTLSKLNKDRILILPGDLPLLSEISMKEIASEDLNHQLPDLSVVSFIPESPYGYGRIVRRKNGSVEKITEEKDCNSAERSISEVNSSIYCTTPEFLKTTVEKLQNNNAQCEYYLTDIVEHGNHLGHLGHLGKNIQALNMGQTSALIGANTRYELLQLEKLRRGQIAKALLESGVSLESDTHLYIDEGINVGSDTFLGAGTRLIGKTSIGNNVIIEGECQIVDSKIADGAHIKFGSVIETSQVDSGCKIGPYAHLRPGTHLHCDVHIGNFVEIKKSEIFPGAKANHLTYIGDATIGARSNIGAGTITCNYDGVNKHRTVIGEGVFVGSNTALVAPVTLGDGSFVGAGSVITKDVPANSLGIGRSKQSNLIDWKKKA
jgi:bifunctional UDP-N-acetylglucosamine pyrophosphorylase/glucosamine-1-phosphate N-acetyltransferase